MEVQKLEECLAIYQNLKSENKKLIAQGVHDYSLINALLKANDEVRLHSRFIFSMINPNGFHYCGNKFLKVFLSLLPDELKSFIDPESARVFREKGKIDLLIHDDNNFLIVENKLNAVDQKYQITRYIQYIQKEFCEDREDISSNIAVIYLSKSRKKPSPESESLIGFRLEGRTLHWEGLPQTPPNDLLTLSIPHGTKIPFVHFSYFLELQNWVTKCTDLAPADGRKNAFEEYQKILDRLDTSKPWRKILNLDQYTLNLPEDKQREIYALMVESRKRLVGFVSQKLFSQMKEIFGEQTIKEHGQYKPLNVESIEEWLLKKGKWKDTGFIAYTQDGQGAGFTFATEYAYFGTYDETSSIYSEKNRVLNQWTRKQLLNDPEGIYKFIDQIKKKKAELKIADVEILPGL